MSDEDRKPGFATRNELIEQGHTTSSLRHRVRTGSIERVWRGIYVPADASSDANEVDRIAAWLHRLGNGSAVSHSSAAIRHGFDSTHGWPRFPVHLLQANQNHPPTADGFSFHRSRTLSADMVELLDDLPTTTRARTVLDVSEHLSLDEIERVLESAIRGPDPRRPHEWRPDVLTQLAAIVDAHPRQPGALNVGHVLRRRPTGVFPTGSLAETAVVQSVRRGGFGTPVRQAKVIAQDRAGHPREHYLDLLLEDVRLDIEVDGSSHDERRQRQADLERDRRLAGALTVIRITGAEAISQPNRIIELISEELRRRESEGVGRKPRFARDLIREGDLWTIRPRTR